MASRLHASNQLPVHDQFELVANETIPLEQPAANPGLSAAMNITRSMKVNTGNTIDVEHFTSFDQRYYVPLDPPQTTVRLPYGDGPPLSSACDLRIQNVFNNQGCSNSTAIFRSPAAEALMRELDVDNISCGSIESYQQYAGRSLSPVSLQPISAPNNHQEPKEFFTNQTENPFLKVNGEITNSLNKDMNGHGGREATNGPTDLSGVIGRKNFNLNIRMPGSDSPLQTTTFRRSLSNSSPVQQIEQHCDGAMHNDGNDLVLVLKKELSNSDVANLGRIILPKREAETHFPHLDDNKMTLMLEMDDLHSDITWEFKFRFWPNNKSRMYVLEHTGEFVRTHKLQVGDILMIYKDKGKEKYMVSHGKNESARNSGGRLKHGKRRTVTQNMLQPSAGEKMPLSNPTQTGVQQINQTQVTFPPLFFAAPSFVDCEDFNKLMP